MAEEQPAPWTHPAAAPGGATRRQGILRPWRSLLTWPEVAFLVLFGLYLGWCVDVQLVFWNQNDLFLWNRRFAKEFLIAAGLPGQWLGKLLLQPCYYGGLGALAITLVVGVMLMAARQTFTRVAPQVRADRAWLAPATMLLILHSQYTHAPGDTLGVALAMTASCLYLRAAGRRRWTCLLGFTAASVLLYYSVSRGYFVFAGCCVVYELLTARRPLLGLAFLVVAIAVPLGIDRSLAQLNEAHWHFELPETSYLIPRRSGSWLLGLLQAYFPVCALLMASKPHIGAWWNRRRQAAGAMSRELERSPRKAARAAEAPQRWGDSEAGDATKRKRRFPRLRASLARAAPYLLLVAAGVGGIRWLASREMKKVLEVDWASNRQQWDRVLRAAAGLPSGGYAEYANQDVNLALYHLGRLSDDMFSCPQLRLFVEHEFGARGRLFSRKACDLFLELGRVNEAEVIAHNDLERHLSAEFLMRCAWTKLIKGRPAAARVYLNVLRDDLIYGSWAEDYLQRFRDKPDLDTPEILRVRSLMIAQDDVHRTQVRLPNGEWSVSAEKILESLLDRNPRNRMAFEYLMAVHLLNKDLDSLAAALPRLQAFSYPATPRLYEEAALLYARDHREALQLTARGAVLSDCPISAATIDRFRRLVEIGNQYRGFANPSAREAVLRDLGRSYFSFYLYGSD